MPNGNAKDWLKNAKAMGLTVGILPSVNSVLVLQGTEFGHVAYVEGLTEDGQITISEGNYDNPCAKKNATCNAVIYANDHAVELVHEQTFKSLDELVKHYKDNDGLELAGFIYANKEGK